MTLTDGFVVDVWADSVQGPSGADDQRDYHFGNLMDVPPDEHGHFEIVGRTPATPSRVLVTVARFPRRSVAHVETAS